jgi:hypothetical protein
MDREPKGVVERGKNLQGFVGGLRIKRERGLRRKLDSRRGAKERRNFGRGARGWEDRCDARG